MADVACSGSLLGACNALRGNICASIPEEHQVAHASVTYLEVTAVYAEHLMIPVIEVSYDVSLVDHRRGVPKAPMASSRSASWTQCNSRQLSCHAPHFPSCLSFFSVVQETFVTISAMSLARFPSSARSPTEGRSSFNSSNMGRKKAYGLDESDSGTYFLSRTS